MNTELGSKRSPALVVLGPTGSGKSELGLALARHFSGEIVNCDSIQIYRGLNIGSAKTPLENRRGIPHHLIDVIGASEELSAGSYARIARETIRDIHAQGGVPIVVGGTGFYLRALLDGLSPAPTRNVRLRERLEQIAARRQNALHRILRRYDPVAAERIHANDKPKLIRALEITFLSGVPATRAQASARQAFEGIAVLKLGLAPDRVLLYERLNERAAWMFHHGLLEETQRLLASGYEAQSKPMQSLGYKQALKVLRRESSIEAAITECQTKTRQYAKRQLTWFRAEQHVEWLNGFGSEKNVQETALEKSSTFLLQHNLGKH
jgi:tRNA dimethylallyltransferase